MTSRAALACAMLAILAGCARNPPAEQTGATVVRTPNDRQVGAANRADTTEGMEATTTGGGGASVGAGAMATRAEATAGSQVVALPDATETVFLDVRYRYQAKVDLTQVRGTPLEPEALHLLKSIRRWRSFMEASGLNPIEAIDRLVVASPSRRSSEFVLIARVSLGEARTRELIAQLAKKEGKTLSWSNVAGRATSDFPIGRGQHVVILPDQWIAVAPKAEAHRFAVVSHAGSNAQLTAGTPMPWAMSQPIADDGAGLVATGTLSEGDRRTHYAKRFTFRARVDGGGNVSSVWRGWFDDAAQAEAAYQYWEERRQSYAGNPVLTLLGLSSAIRDAAFSREGEVLRFTLGLTVKQMALLIRFATPILTGTGR